MTPRTKLVWIFPMVVICLFTVLYTNGGFKGTSLLHGHVTSSVLGYKENQILFDRETPNVMGGCVIAQSIHITHKYQSLYRLLSRGHEIIKRNSSKEQRLQMNEIEKFHDTDPGFPSYHLLKLFGTYPYGTREGSEFAESAFKKTSSTKRKQRRGGLSNENIQHVVDHFSLNTNANDWWKQNDLMSVKTPKFDPRFKNPCWYNGSRFHCLPYVFLIGMRKAGTSDITSYLPLHPEIAVHGKPPAAHWFSRNRFNLPEQTVEGFQSYVRLWDKQAQNILRAAYTTTDGKKYNKHILFDRQNHPLFCNMYWRMLSGNEGLDEPRYIHLDYMKHIVPTAKAFMTVRNPVDRLYSDYKVSKKSKLCSENPYQPTLEHFHERVEKATQMYKDCFRVQPIRACLYNETLACTSGLQLRLSITVEYIKEALRVFGRENFYIFSFAHYAQNRTLELANLFDFLGLRQLTQAENAEIMSMPRKNTGKVQLGPMLQKTRQILEDFFTPFNQELAKLVAENSYQYEI